MNMSSIKLSQHVKNWLREAIEADVYQAGDQIPSENDLVAKFGVSRSTIRHAISELALEGWLYRIQGRGTFVSRPKFRQTLSRLTSFTEDMHMLGLTPKARLLLCQPEKPDQIVMKKLGLSSGDDVIRLERLRLADDEPVAINISILPHKLVPGLEKMDLENQSLYEILEKHYGHIIARAEQTLEPILADEAAAQLLEVPPNTPLLLVEGVTYLRNNVAIERLKIFYCGERYKFHLSATR